MSIVIPEETLSSSAASCHRLGSLRGLWDYLCTAWARRIFDQLYAWASRSKLKLIEKVAKMLKRHLDNVLTYVPHRMANATAEGINSKIMAIKRRAGGYRNKEHWGPLVAGPVWTTFFGYLLALAHRGRSLQQRANNPLRGLLDSISSREPKAAPIRRG